MPYFTAFFSFGFGSVLGGEEERPTGHRGGGDRGRGGEEVAAAERTVHSGVLVERPAAASVPAGTTSSW